MSFALRPYQIDCIAACHDALQVNRSVLFVQATGLGKTEQFVEIAREWPGRVMVIAPMIQLVSQAAKKLEKRTGQRVSIEQGASHSVEAYFDRPKFVVASKASLTSKRIAKFRDIGLVIIDEAHLAITDDWERIIAHFIAANPDCKVLGCTATPMRLDKKSLGRVFEHCCYQYGIIDAIPDGWLVPAEARCISLRSLNLKDTRTGRDGDFVAEELAKELENPEVIFEVAETAVAESDQGRLKTAVFCESVQQAKWIANRINDHHKLKAEWVCGDMQQVSAEERQRILARVETGETRFICNVGVLTTGWDCPSLEHIVQARPTKSIALYTQVLGRGTRPLPGTVEGLATPEERRAAIAASAKPYIRVTDLVDNSRAHKLIGVTDVLGADRPDAVMDRVRELLAKQNERKSADELLELAQQQIDEEAARREEARQREEAKKLQAKQDAEKAAEERRKRMEEADRKRRERLADVTAEVSYSRQQVDVFGGAESQSKSVKRVARGPVLPFGKYKGIQVGEVPSGYLRWLIENTQASWISKACKDELAMRDGAKPTGDKPRNNLDIEQINLLFKECA